MINTGLSTPSEVAGYAHCALIALRHAGLTNDEILTRHCPVDASALRDADARMEARQVNHYGHVVAPAAYIRDTMRRLVLAGQ